MILETLIMLSSKLGRKSLDSTYCAIFRNELTTSGIIKFNMFLIKEQFFPYTNIHDIHWPHLLIRFLVLPILIKKCCARNRYQRRWLVITSHNNCGIELLVHVPDNCSWHKLQLYSNWIRPVTYSYRLKLYQLEANELKVHGEVLMHKI